MRRLVGGDEGGIRGVLEEGRRLLVIFVMVCCIIGWGRCFLIGASM